MGTQAQAPVVRGLSAALAAIFGPSARERRKQEREAAWKREEEIVREARKQSHQAGKMDEKEWFELVTGRRDGPR